MTMQSLIEPRSGICSTRAPEAQAERFRTDYPDPRTCLPQPLPCGLGQGPLWTLIGAGGATGRSPTREMLGATSQLFTPSPDQACRCDEVHCRLEIDSTPY